MLCPWLRVFYRFRKSCLNVFWYQNTENLLSLCALHQKGKTLQHTLLEIGQLNRGVFSAVFPFFSQLDGRIKRSHIKLKEVMDNDHGRNDLNDVSTAHKCNQCEYTSFQAGYLRKHLKTHSGKKPHKCNQCEFASSLAGNLRTHLKMHSGEKSNKCNQCDFTSS